MSFDYFVEEYPLKKIKYCFWLIDAERNSTKHYIHWSDKNEMKEISDSLEEFNIKSGARKK